VVISSCYLSEGEINKARSRNPKFILNIVKQTGEGYVIIAAIDFVRIDLQEEGSGGACLVYKPFTAAESTAQLFCALS